MYVRVMVARDASVQECAFSRMAAGDESVLAPSALCAGGLAPAGMPVADSLLAMFFIAKSAVEALSRALLTSGGNCVRISTYVFLLTSTYVLVCQAHPYSGVLSYARACVRQKVSKIVLGAKYVGRMVML